MGSYDDGIYYYFGGDKTPQHITLEMWTDDPDIETCDLRLTSINSNLSTPYANITGPNVTVQVGNKTVNQTLAMPKLANFSKN